jgi:hypothetical protein
MDLLIGCNFPSDSNATDIGELQLRKHEVFGTEVDDEIEASTKNERQRTH